MNRWKTTNRRDGYSYFHHPRNNFHLNESTKQITNKQKFKPSITYMYISYSIKPSIFLFRSPMKCSRMKYTPSTLQRTQPSSLILIDRIEAFHLSSSHSLHHISIFCRMMMGYSRATARSVTIGEANFLINYIKKKIKDLSQYLIYIVIIFDSRFVVQRRRWG